MRAAFIQNGIVTNIIEVDFLDQRMGLVDAGRARIGDAWNGTIFTPPAVNLTPLITAFVKQVDVDGDAIYDAVIGNRLSEYTQAEADAQAYKTAGYTGTVPGSVQCWATAKGQTAQWAADDILTTAAAWLTAQLAIRQNRLGCKEAARNAATLTALTAAQTAWSAFVSTIRMQLGI
jgi:hypothetical protein